MSLIYTWANSIRLLREKAKRNPLDSYHYDIHPRIHNIDDVSEKIYEELGTIDNSITSLQTSLQNISNDIVVLLPGLPLRTATDYEIYCSISLIYILDKLNIADSECMYIQLTSVIEPNSETNIDNNIVMQAELVNTSEILKTVEFRPVVPKYQEASMPKNFITFLYFFSSSELRIYSSAERATRLRLYTAQLDDVDGKGYTMPYSYIKFGKAEQKSGLVSY